jgi:uncharacterized protein
VIFNEIVSNKVLVAGIIGWAAAQILKIIITTIAYKKFDASRIVGSGGMPSSHSAFVMSIAVKVGVIHGYNSTLFALAMALACIVMYDAAGVRRAAGNQARIINFIIDDLSHIIEDLSHHKGIREERLKELIGHTPIEVIAGALLGIIVGVVA